MKAIEILSEDIHHHKQPDLMQALRDFLPLAMRELEITKLPKITLEKHIDDQEQPTFGRFVNDDVEIHLGIANRHPIDILRTLAHELVHFKQYLENKLGPNSGETGSPEENEAHEVAGVIMRHFNKKHPDYFYSEPLDLPIKENFADGKKPGRKGLAKRSGVNCKASVTQLRKVAKNSSGERARMAHWCANMKQGRAK